jgi:transcriptional regulator with XRE-family HTH domain
VLAVKSRRGPDEVAFYAEVGRRVAQARNAAGLSQQQLADMLQLRQTAISYYEGGKRGMPLATFADLADALNVDPAELLNGSGP